MTGSAGQTHNYLTTGNVLTTTTGLVYDSSTDRLEPEKTMVKPRMVIIGPKWRTGSSSHMSYNNYLFTSTTVVMYIDIYVCIGWIIIYITLFIYIGFGVLVHLIE